MKENILEKKYTDLPGSKPVTRAVSKARRGGEHIPDTKADRVQTYLDRLDKIVDSERGWELLKHTIINKFAIDPSDHDTLEKIAHGLYESEKRIAIEQGRGADIRALGDGEDIIGKYRALVHEKRDIQEKSLSVWLEYLQQNDAQYPTWFRYFVVRNLQKMGSIDKERGEYTKRTAHTVAPFPELNSEALGFVYRALTTGIAENAEKREQLQKLIVEKNFPKLYAFAQIETQGNANRESLIGEWVKYDQGSDHHILESALRGKGTGWCTAEGSAYSQLQGGDFYVYFTKGPDGVFTEPRIAIRTDEGRVAEVRGVNHRQELEPDLIATAEEKYHAMPNGNKYDKISADMKRMTKLTALSERGGSLAKDDLRFLYELEAPIEGFGYDRDPRVQELRAWRNPREDAPILFGCQPEQIAWNEHDITESTTAYIGPLGPSIFSKLNHVEHVYTKFLEGEIRFKTISLGEQSPDEYRTSLKAGGYKTGSYGDYMLGKMEKSAFRGEMELVMLSVADLGFPGGATRADIYAKAINLGLEICPAQVGPALRLQYTNQPKNDYLLVGMEPITDRDGGPEVFNVSRGGDDSWLNDDNGHAGYFWRGDYRWVFARRKF